MRVRGEERRGEEGFITNVDLYPAGLSDEEALKHPDVPQDHYWKGILERLWGYSQSADAG